MRPARRRTAVLAVLVVAALVCAGCVRMPESGPVHAAPAAAAPGGDVGSYYDPPGPQAGDAPQDIVLGFLDAMQAAPIRTDIAKEFLSRDAQAGWDPQGATLVYDNRPQPRGTSQVTITLDGVRLDASGAWEGDIPDSMATLRFPMVLDDAGEWRIDEAPDALIVPRYFFDQWFARQAVYFFEPSGRFLVPQPVYVPKGDQLPAALVGSLLRGPGPGLGRILRSYLPADLRLELGVPVSQDGVADLALRGDSSRIPAHDRELMLAQLAWTLRGDPSISSFRVSLGGEPLVSADGTSQFSLEQGTRYDPVGPMSTSALFGLAHGVLVAGDVGEMTPVPGSAGQQPPGWDRVSVDPSGSLVAGVSEDGTAVMIAPVRASDAAEQVVAGADGLLPPRWDLARRLWLVERAGGRARVSYVADDRPLPLDVPGITGRDVRGFLVSRDGTRLVAVVRTPEGDRVVVSRIRYGARGGVQAATPARRLTELTGTPRITDIGWQNPLAVHLVHRIGRDLSQVATLSIEGSPPTVGDHTTTVTERVLGIVSSVSGTDETYLRTRSGVVTLGDPRASVDVGDVAPRTLTYPG